MTPEWEELKSWLISCGFGYGSAVKKMEDIEHRTLPERVAGLLAGFDHRRWTLSLPNGWSGAFGDLIIAALLTGDTSELEKWQVKK